MNEESDLPLIITTDFLKNAPIGDGKFDDSSVALPILQFYGEFIQMGAISARGPVLY